MSICTHSQKYNAYLIPTFCCLPVRYGGCSITMTKILLGHLKESIICHSKSLSLLDVCTYATMDAIQTIATLAGLHLEGAGRGTRPLDILLPPPLNYHAMCLHMQTYAPSPPHSHIKPYFAPP